MRKLLMQVCVSFQCEQTIVKFWKNGVCMDTTHAPNQYDFLLLTLLDLDEYGEGIPVGWMISNREAGTVIVEFLKSIKNQV